MDTYYSSCLGKRKTYIVPAQYSIGILFILSSFIIDGLIENTEIFKLAILGILFSILNSIEDVALDAWVIKLVSEKN